MYAAIAAILVVMGFGAGEPAVLTVAVIVAGGFLGVINTVLTELVMKVSPVERPIASSAYSFLRFAGGAIAPWLAGKLAEWVAPDTPFFVGAAAVGAALLVLVAGRRYLVEAPEVEEDVAAPSAAPVLVAIGATPAAAAATARAAELAAARGTAVEVLHVRPSDVVAGEGVADLEQPAEAHAILQARLAQLEEAGVPAGGRVVHTVGDHDDIVRAVLAQARAVNADTVVVGASTHRGHRVGAELQRIARQPVVVVPVAA
jgi:nucleotide-binding universal stress UspA family protein